MVDREKHHLLRDSLIAGEYEVCFGTGPLIPPVSGTYNYYARAQVYKRSKDKVTPVSDDFGVTCGVTQEEAIEKMKQRVLKWIESQRSGESRKDSPVE